MPSDHLRIAFIGAGGVNFGGPEGPWDHASRLEQIEGLKVVGICDIHLERAQRQLKRRLQGKNPEIYAGCAVFDDWEQMLDRTEPDAVWIGLPPFAHGRASGPGAVELGCAQRGVHILVEKPLAAGAPEQVRAVAEALSAARARDGSPLIASVGYMLRYSSAVEQMRRMIGQATADGRPARLLAARYNCAYSTIETAYWDGAKSGGPIIEQATHFVDLARYLLGEIVPESINAAAIPAGHPLGALVDQSRDARGRGIEERLGIAEQDRIPRATVATWRFESGALGSLVHGVLAHGVAYEAELEVWGDGLMARLVEPYTGSCRLQARDRQWRYEAQPVDGINDMYLDENLAFVRAITGGRPELVRSPYADALKTFEVTCIIAARSAAGP